MPTPDSTRRRFRLSPERFVVGLLIGICLLWLSERFQWFGFNHHMGWTVLIAVAAVGAAALVMLLWWAAGLIFHWRFQFGIRSVLAFSLACSIAVDWLAVETERATRQSQSLSVINGEWHYDWECDDNGWMITNPEPPGSGWLSNLLGIDFFSEVVALNFIKQPNVTDTELENVKRFANLRKLSLEWDDITDAGLEQLKGLKQLRGLNLQNTKVTESGVRTLQRTLPKCDISY